MISHPSLKRNTSQSPKQQLFRFFHKLLYQYKISEYFFIFLLIIQSLQIVYFGIHPVCCYLWEVPGLGVVRNGLGYVAGVGLWTDGGDGVRLGFNVGGFLVGVVGVVVVGYQVSNGKPNDLTVTNSFHQLRIKFIQYLSILLRTIAPIPLSSLLTSTILSHKASPSALTTTSLIFSILSCLICSILLYLFLELFIDSSPFSGFSLSGCISLNQKYRTELKVVVGVVAACLPNRCQGAYDGVHLGFVGVLGVGFWYLSYLHYTEANLVNNLIRKYLQHSNITILTLYTQILLQNLITPSQQIPLFFTLTICILANIGWARAKRSRENSLIFSVYKGLSTKGEILAYNYLMAQYVRDFYREPLCLVKLQGIFTDHLLNCKKLDDVCRCRALKSKIRAFGYENDRVQAQLQAPNWFQFLKSNLLINTQKMNHLPQFYLLLSSIQKHILSNNFISYANLQKCSNKKTSLSIQFLIYHQKRIIERAFLQEDLKNNQKKQIDVNKFIEMSELVDGFIGQVLRSSVQHLDFWKGLAERRRSREVVMKEGTRLLETVKECEQTYNTISQKYPHNLQSIVLFSNYSKYILNNHEQILKNRALFNLIKKKLCRSIKISTQQQKQKYSQNSITGSLIISGKKTNIGIIKACSSKIAKILKYAPYQLIGQNVNTIMPVFLGHLHNQVLVNYLDQAEPQSNFIERLAPMLDKNNFMILSRIMTKPIPSLINGLQIIGIFEKVKQNNIRHMNESPKYMLYRCDNGNIEALSQNFNTHYGYRLMKVNQFYEISQELNFSNVFQGITTNDIKDSEEGHQCVLKTKKNFKKTVRVKVYVRMELVYFGTKVRLLSIFTSNQGNFNTLMLHNAMTINPVNNHSALQDRSSEQQQNQQPPQSEAGPDPKKNPQILSQQQLKQLQTKVPLKYRIFQSILLLFVISVLAISATQFYFNVTQVGIVKNYLEHSQYLSNSLVYLVNIGYYVRMMQVAGKEGLRGFEDYKGNVSVYTDSLQKAEFWLVNKESEMKDKIKFSFDDMPVSWQIGEQGNIFSKQSTLNLHIFDLVTSSSSFSSSTPSHFTFPYSLINPNTTPPAQSNPYYRNLFHVRYTTLFQLIPAKLKYTQKLFKAYTEKITQFFHIGYIEIGVAFGLVLVFLVIDCKIVYNVLCSIFSITTLFNWLTPNQIQKEIVRCETFLEHFFISSYEVVVRMKKNQILRGHSFEETQGVSDKNNKLMKTKHFFLDDEGQKEGDEKGLECTDEIDLVEISQKNLKDKDAKVKEGAQNAQETCPLKSEGQLESTQNEQQQNESIFFSNMSAFLPIILGFLLVLIYFICIFLYSKVCDSRTLTQLRNQNLINLNLQTLQMLKYYGLESTIDSSAFRSYPLLSDSFVNISLLVYQYQQQLNKVSGKYGNGNQSGNGNEDYRSVELQALLEDANGGGLCQGEFVETKVYAKSSFSTAQCQSIQNGLLKQGLRASIVAYIQSTKTKKTLTSLTSPSSSLPLTNKYLTNTLLKISQKNTKNTSTYISSQITISIVLFSLFVVYVVVIGVFMSMRIGKEFMMKILGTYQIVSLIPQRVFRKNVNLCVEYRKNVKELLE